MNRWGQAPRNGRFTGIVRFGCVAARRLAFAVHWGFCYNMRRWRKYNGYIKHNGELCDARP